MQTEKNPLSVIDALSGGYQVVARRLWVLVIPIALNVFLWLGPQISARPLFQQVVGMLSIPPPMEQTPETIEGLELFKEGLRNVGESFNLFEFLGIAMPGLVPVDTDPATMPRSVLFTVADAPSLLVIAAVLTLIGFFFLALYLEGIARGVRAAQSGRVFQSYWHIAGLIGLLLCIGAIIGLPALIGAALITPVNPALGSFLILLIFMLMLWALMYLTFALPAIFVSGANAFQAIAYSIAIFRGSFWSAIGLVFLVYIIQMGFGVVWEQLENSAWSIALEIIANAFLASGLVAGLMLFYLDRSTRLAQGAHQRARSSLKS